METDALASGIGTPRKIRIFPGKINLYFVGNLCKSVISVDDRGHFCVLKYISLLSQMTRLISDRNYTNGHSKKRNSMIFISDIFSLLKVINK
jgi:hypothetical protein